jgi:hypothetical protein
MSARGGLSSAPLMLKKVSSDLTVCLVSPEGTFVVPTGMFDFEEAK